MTTKKQITEKVTFLSDVEVKDHTGKIEFKASRGNVKTLPAPSARRWIRRGVAVKGGTEQPAKTEAPADVSKDKTKPATK